MKKALSMLLAVIMVLTLMVGCGDKNNNDNNQGTKTYPESFAGMEDLIAAAQAEGELTVYGGCEEEYLSAACDSFEKIFGIKVNRQRLSTGEIQAKIQEEAGNPSADVAFGGTTDPYNMMAKDGLLEAYEATNAKHLLKPMYRDADGYWYGIYQGILGFMVNTDELTRMGLEAPKDWPDLLKEEYKGLVWMSNYNTAGTAKLVLNTMIQMYGHDEGIKYLVDLDKNISLIIPSSGTSFEIGATAIFKGAKHPNAAKLFIEYALSPECVNQAASTGSYQFLVIDNATQPEAATEFGLDPTNVMDYDFEDAKQNTTQYISDIFEALGAAADDRFQTE